MKKNKETLKLGSKEINFEIGGLALQANGSIVVSCGGTVILATAVASSRQSDLDYFPLQVEYVERLYAGGRIKGSRWVKREGKPTDEVITKARLIDRCIRPLFPKEFKHEVQVVVTILSLDHENDPSDLGLLAVAAALHISNIPWYGPIGAVRVGTKDDVFLVNPLKKEKESSSLDLIVADSKDGVMMLEGAGEQISEEKFFEAIAFASEYGKTIREFLDKLREKYGQPKMKYETPALEESSIQQIDKIVGSKINSLINELCSDGKREEEVSQEMFSNLDLWTEEVKAVLGEEIKGQFIKEVINKLFKKALRKSILAGKRIGDRKINEIRPLVASVSLLPRTHGSATFQRGLTKTLSVVTLGTPSLKQLIENAEGEETKRYMHHYFMPPYSVGETGRMGWPKRREVGHGALAEKALLPVIPSEDKFPYAIRVVSEIVSSNGSTSMASVCGSTLSLMDAGVPISAPVAGISVGLIKEGDKSVLLTDIAGVEDFNGDMDFKVAGTEKGITAVQVDIKTSGLSMEVIKEALEKAKEARGQILAVMTKAISEPRKNVSQYAPKVSLLHIAPEEIGGVIGPGGKIIRKMIEKSGCDINIEDDGTVSVSGIDQKMVDGVIDEIKAMTREIKMGEKFTGVVKRLQQFGAFIEFLPGKEGLVHISKLGSGFIRHPRDVLKMGEKVDVEVIKVDEMGRIDLGLTKPLASSPKKESSFRHPSASADQKQPAYRQPKRQGGGAVSKSPFNKNLKSRFAPSRKKFSR